MSDDPRIDVYQEALQRILSWAEAYPLDIFPEPDFAKARQLLEAGGITLDVVSASCMRRVVEGVGEIARAALYEVVTAPWTEQQVAALNRWQANDAFHDFTCPNDHIASRTLVATRDGWVCPGCAYTQNWAHGFMTVDQ